MGSAKKIVELRLQQPVPGVIKYSRNERVSLDEDWEASLDVLADLDDSLVTLNTILGSRYCSHIRLDVTKYQRELILLQETLDEWLACQKH